MTSRQYDTEVLIIGAGTSGLALGYELERGGAVVRIVEAARRPAERWRHRHPQLHLNTHKLLSHLPGRRFARNVSGFPTRNEVIRYIEHYERRLNVSVEYGVRIDAIRREGDLWLADRVKGLITARDLVIATGPDNHPVIPDWPGKETFTGELIHAADFGAAEQYADKRVLLVGAGNSSVDIANHLARVGTNALWMSVRGGSTVVPQYVLGAPVHLLTPMMRPLPVSMIDRIASWMSRWFCGDLRKFGMPSPEKGALSRILDDGAAPAIDNGFSRALKEGRIKIAPAIERFENSKVYLVDEMSLEPDVVICGTGYRTGLETLVGDLDVLDANGAPMFSADQSSPAYPGLWFFGFKNSFWGNLNERRHEARRLANRIAKRQSV
ncbi:MAG: NAD(P)/FAD-dependent oxidoreductase [Pseudomonadota bacterium]